MVLLIYHSSTMNNCRTMRMVKCVVEKRRRRNKRWQPTHTHAERERENEGMEPDFQ